MLQVYKERSKTIKMDLNEIPPEFHCDFLDCSDANPSYCTQAVEAIALGESMTLCRLQVIKF